MNESYVLVEGDSTVQDTTLLTSLAPYFPSISHPERDTGAFSYEQLESTLETRRSRQDGKLFIDDLLELLDIDGPSVYPPHSAAALNSLLFDLLDSQQGLRGQCAIFYLLLASSPDSTKPSQFARDMLLPTGFVRGIEAFYALDVGDWKRGVCALTDPHLTPDFVAKTFVVLSTLPDVQDRAGLVLAFWRLSGVELEGEETMGIVLDALCDRERRFGVVEAWALQRKWGEVEGQVRLATRILASCFGDNSTSTPVAHHLQALLSHPFTSAEDALSHAFCLDPPASISTTFAALAADWRISKYVAEGRPVEALRFGGQVAANGLPRGEERARLLRAVRETLTEVQKNQVDLDAEGDAEQSTTQGIATAAAASNAKSAITQPAWQPIDSPTPPLLPRSLLSLHQSPAPPPPPTASELPLSASPFLRREKPLVSSFDGSALGGAQKSVLRALREGAFSEASVGGEAKGKGKAEPFGSPARLPGFMSPSRSGIVAGTSESDFSYRGDSPARGSSVFGADGREVPLARKPTLSGFGSVRMPPTPSRPSWLGDGPTDDDVAATNPWHERDDDGDADMLSPPPPPRALAPKVPTASSSTFNDIQDQQRSSFASRAAHDPVIAAAIAQAAADSSPPSRAPPKSTSTSSKRRNFSSQAPASKSGDKRRAVSTEAEDRPSGSLRLPTEVPKTPRPPGAFPGHSDADDDVEVPAERAGGEKARPTRRSARASSAVAEPSTSRGRRAVSVAPQEEEGTPKAAAVRRSSRRLTTPAKVPEQGEQPTKKKAVAKKGGRKRIVEEED